MSQDLFAAFESESNASSKATTAQFEKGTADWGDTKSLRGRLSTSAESEVFITKPELHRSSAPTQEVEEDDDDFGEFEDGSSWEESQKVSAEGLHSWEASVRVSEPPREGVNVAQSHRTGMNSAQGQSLPALSDSQAAYGSPSHKSKGVNVGQHPFAGRMDLLFEADDDEYHAGADELGDLSQNPEAAMAYSKRLVQEQRHAALIGMKNHSSKSQLNPKPMSRPQPKMKTAPAPKAVTQGPNKLRKKSGYVQPKDPNVLFDAENISEDTDSDADFGGLEEAYKQPTRVSAAPKPKPALGAGSAPAVDLLGIEEQPPPSTGVAASRPVTRSKPSAPTSAPVPPPVDDDWDDFEGTTPTAPTSGASPLHLRSATISLNTSNAPILPPTNVPPPSTLLTLTSHLLAHGDAALFNIIPTLDHQSRQSLLTHPGTHTFLAEHLSHANALAHIIAGRKQRWKRDQRLAQSMRIGPAAAGGKGGMKLTGVDRTEVAKEDREVVDAVRLWRGKAGKLRSAVSVAATSTDHRKLPPVPEITEAIPVKILKAAEGGLVAPKACAVCGLKREERVGKVDVGVEDSFGEWWIDGADMHRGCWAFWEEFGERLKSR